MSSLGKGPLRAVPCRPSSRAAQDHRAPMGQGSPYPSLSAPDRANLSILAPRSLAAGEPPQLATACARSPCARRAVPARKEAP